MYLNHFNLAERPFSIAPDPRFLFMSRRHREALAHLLYGLGEGGGFVQLTGEVGTGKTTICRCLLEQVPDNVDIALVLNPKVTAEELIATVCDELGVSYPEEIHSIKVLTDLLNEHLLEAYTHGRRVVLVIDEAQNLSAEVLEQVRLLTNLETATQKLLQIILIGQPELRDLLLRQDMRQLAQRVTARYHLEPISRNETIDYIRHRLQVCGTSHAIFNKGAIATIHHLSGGIPRLINVLCDRAMLGAYVEGKLQVDRSIVRKAAREVLGQEQDEQPRQRWLPRVAGGLMVLGLLAVLWYRPWEFVPAPGLSGNNDAVSAAVPNHLSAAPARPKPQAGSRPPHPAAVQVRPMTAMAAVPAEQLLPAAVEGASQPSLEGVLQGLGNSWYRHAWTALFAEWGLDLPPSVTPDFCEFASSNGLRCMYERGTWGVLRYFDRPALLRLVLADGKQVSAALLQLDGDIAKVVLDDTVMLLPITEIDRYWYGDYVLLLRAPPAGTMIMKAGGRWSDVPWLREQLGLIEGIELETAEPELFDPLLHKQLLTFQRDRGLVADGVVGKHTIILLNTQANRPGIPRLVVESSRAG